MNILISGGAGFVGSYVCNSLISKKHKVDIIDTGRFYLPSDNYFVKNQNLKSKLRLGINNHYNHSILDTSYLLNLLNNNNYDTLIHLAANPLATSAMKNPLDAFNEIVCGTNSICEAVRLSVNSSKTKIVLISSSMVYGDFVNSEALESDKCEPKDMYGSFKYTSEIILKSYIRNFSLNGIIVRPSAVYGPGDHNKRVIQSLLQNVKLKKKIEIFDPDETHLDFTHVSELANAICLLATKKVSNGNIYNATRGEARSLRDVANIIKEIVPDCIIVEKKNKENFRPKRGKLNNKKIIKDVGAVFNIDLEKGINNYWQYINEKN